MLRPSVRSFSTAYRYFGIINLTASAVGLYQLREIIMTTTVWSVYTDEGYVDSVWASKKDAERWVAEDKNKDAWLSIWETHVNRYPKPERE